jgi:hypothetical protein
MKTKKDHELELVKRIFRKTEESISKFKAGFCAEMGQSLFDDLKEQEDNLLMCGDLSMDHDGRAAHDPWGEEYTRELAIIRAGIKTIEGTLSLKPDNVSPGKVAGPNMA